MSFEELEKRIKALEDINQRFAEIFLSSMETDSPSETV